MWAKKARQSGIRIWTKGSYKKLAELFHISKGDYRRLMDFSSPE